MRKTHLPPSLPKRPARPRVRVRTGYSLPSTLDSAAQEEQTTTTRGSQAASAAKTLLLRSKDPALFAMKRSDFGRDATI